MKKHILGSVSKKAKLLLNNTFFYDFKRQMSFIDEDKTIPVINFAKENTVVETSTIENSDPDEFCLDFSGTKETRSIEDSDIDMLTSFASRITKRIENSDVDEFAITPPRTTQTFTIENSDTDEFSLE